MERSDPRKRLVLPTRPLVTLLKPRVSAAMATAREFYKFPPLSPCAIRPNGRQIARKNLSGNAPQMVRFSRHLLTEAEGDFLEPL